MRCGHAQSRPLGVAGRVRPLIRAASYGGLPQHGRQVTFPGDAPSDDEQASGAWPSFSLFAIGRSSVPQQQDRGDPEGKLARLGLA